MTKISLIKDAILSEEAALCYTSHDSTLQHKLAICKSFLDFLDKHPDEAISFLYDKKRINVLHKIFQKYIFFLEKEIPFAYLCNKKMIYISSLLDEELNLFDGISTFESIVLNNKIQNETQENYHEKRYFIGKVISITELKSNNSLMNNIKEYTFNHIITTNLDNGIKIQVKHLRVPPHYQMNGMTHIQRIKKSIIKRIEENK